MFGRLFEWERPSDECDAAIAVRPRDQTVIYRTMIFLERIKIRSIEIYARFAVSRNIHSAWEAHAPILVYNIIPLKAQRSTSGIFRPVMSITIEAPRLVSRLLRGMDSGRMRLPRGW
jgi:hypothetical protein